ncbi:MAG: hypothetical protein KAT58_01500 [candidate division Zixibacteria bacterium]|nr:hypothetical protein [candidate division Zixibacteria bacterium]
MYPRRLASNWVVYFQGWNQVSWERFYGLDTLGTTAWTCSLSFVERSLHRGHIRGNDTLLELVVSEVNYNLDIQSSYLLCVDPRDGTMMERVELPNRNTSRWNTWRITSSYLVYSYTGRSSLLSGNRDSLRIYRKDNLDNYFTIIPDNKTRHFRTAGDTLAWTEPDSNRYMIYDLLEGKTLLDYRYDFVGSGFSAGIDGYHEGTIYDYDSTHYYAISCTASQQHGDPVKWATAYREFAGEGLRGYAAQHRGRIFISTTKDNLIVLNKESGRYLGTIPLLWTKGINDYYREWHIAADDERVYVFSGDGIIYAVRYNLN